MNVKSNLFFIILFIYLAGCAGSAEKCGVECVNLSQAQSERFEKEMPALERAAQAGGMQEKIAYANALSAYGEYWYKRSLFEKTDFYANAKVWFENSVAQHTPAARGSCIAESYLADMYHEGRGVEKNYSKAAKLYKNSMRAFNKAAEMYENGADVGKNVEIANQLYAEAKTAELNMRAAYSKAAEGN